MADGHPLFRAAVLEFTCTASFGRQSAEVSDGTGRPLATADKRGAIVDPLGTELLQAPVRFDRRIRGTETLLEVADPDGAPLGEARVRKFTYGPRSFKATISLTSGEDEVARFDPESRGGETLAISAGGRSVGTLRRTAKRGFIRTTTDYRLELTGEVDERLRQLLVAAAIRYHALVTRAIGESQ